jgi:hypothetical protein
LHIDHLHILSRVLDESDIGSGIITILDDDLIVSGKGRLSDCDGCNGSIDKSIADLAIGVDRILNVVPV